MSSTSNLKPRHVCSKALWDEILSCEVTLEQGCKWLEFDRVHEQLASETIDKVNEAQRKLADLILRTDREESA